MNVSLTPRAGLIKDLDLTVDVSGYLCIACMSCVGILISAYFRPR